VKADVTPVAYVVSNIAGRVWDIPESNRRESVQNKIG
jgi:hypothetical protein